MEREREGRREHRMDKKDSSLYRAGTVREDGTLNKGSTLPKSRYESGTRDMLPRLETGREDQGKEGRREDKGK